MDDAGGDTEKTEDSEETEDIRGLFSGVNSTSISLTDFLFGSSEGTLGSEMTSLLSSAGLTTDAGSSFNSALAFGGWLFFIGDWGSSVFSSFNSFLCSFSGSVPTSARSVSLSTTGVVTAGVGADCAVVFNLRSSA